MTENLLSRPDERIIDIGAMASDAYPYIRFLSEKDVRILHFMVIDDMPTIVIAYIDKQKDWRVQWWGFHAGQWYTDFKLAANENELHDLADTLLENAEMTLMEDIHEPKLPDLELELPSLDNPEDRRVELSRIEDEVGVIISVKDNKAIVAPYKSKK